MFETLQVSRMDIDLNQQEEVFQLLLAQQEELFQLLVAIYAEFGEEAVSVLATVSTGLGF